MKKDYKYNRVFEAMKNNVCDTSYGLCPAPMSAQKALDILASYLLGDDYYVTNSISQAQMNAVITEQILDKYSKQWKRDWGYYEKTAWDD